MKELSREAEEVIKKKSDAGGTKSPQLAPQESPFQPSTKPRSYLYDANDQLESPAREELRMDLDELRRQLKQGEERKAALQRKPEALSGPNFIGRVVWEGSVVGLSPRPVSKDKAAFGNAPGFRNDSLQINKSTKGVAGVFVYLDRAPKDYRPRGKVVAKREFGVRGRTFAPRNMVLQPVRRHGSSMRHRSRRTFTQDQSETHSGTQY